jgi:23S rRNA (adenine2503-C2)-methyltransferase
MVQFYDLTFNSLKDQLNSRGLKENEARLIFNWFYKKRNSPPCEMFGISKKTHEFLNQLNFEVPKITTVKNSEDKTVKFLLQLSDSSLIETVLIPFNQKYTVCVSSQVGCLMNCSFCYTGKQGFTRHLRTFEIVGQLLAVQKWLTKERPHEDLISNIVFMGQGEPLHNFDNVRDAIKIFISQYGFSLADHKITVSTSGYLPGLERWKSEMPTVNIALSLHTIDNEKRSEIIPLNKKYPVNEVINLVESIPSGKKRFVTYEYLLIDDFNDSESEAKKLGEKLSGTKAFLNLIPFNPIPGSHYRRPSEDKITKFMNVVSQFGFPVTRRSTKGSEILAACGQLNSKI